MFMFTPWLLLEQYMSRVRIFFDKFFKTQLILVFLKINEDAINEDALDPLHNDILAQMTLVSSN